MESAEVVFTRRHNLSLPLQKHHQLFVPYKYCLWLFVSIAVHIYYCFYASVVVSEIVFFWVCIIAMIGIWMLPRLLALAIEPQIVLLLPKAVIYYIVLVGALIYPLFPLHRLWNYWRRHILRVKESFADFLLLVLYEVVVVAVGSQAFVTHVFTNIINLYN